jgi:hypothetical protein
MAGRWSRLGGSPVLLAALGVVSLALLAWAMSLRQANAKLASELRGARQGSRPALRPAPNTDAPAELKDDNQRLRRELQEMAVPQINVASVSISPGTQRAPVVPAASTTLLVLRPPTTSAPPEYRLRVLAHDGSIVWEGSGLRRGPDGTLMVVWPAALARPGGYRLELFGPAPTDRRLESFPLVVQP